MRVFVKPPWLRCLFVGAVMLACAIVTPKVNAEPSADSSIPPKSNSPARTVAGLNGSPTADNLHLTVEPGNQLAAANGPSNSPNSVANSDSFVDSIGFNAHFENYHTPYVTQFEQVKSLLGASGVRHVRVGMWFGRNEFYDLMKQLAASGIFGSYTTSPKYTQSQIQTFPSLVGASFEQYEAPNEPDLQGNPNWVEPTRTFQMNLYSWVKGDPATSKFPVVGPALTGGEKSHTTLGDLSAYLDYANIHDYFSVFNPGTPGWGSRSQFGVYGSVHRSLNLVALVAPSKPVMSTESGFGGKPTGDEMVVDFRTQMRYLTRLFFEHFNTGVVRTYSYEFIDKGGTGPYAYFGVLQNDLTPKPAYTAIKSLVGALKDPGPAFTPTPLSFQLSGSTTNVHHTLLQKRNGQYVLALWQEVPSWKPHGGGGDIIVPDQTVTLSTGTSFSSAKLSTMDENGNLSTHPLSWSNNAATFAVSDKVSLVTLSP